MTLLALKSARRWLFLAGAVLFVVGSSYFGIRNALAVHYAGLGTLKSLRRATQLEPGDARNWYLLGRYWQFDMDQPDIPQAIEAYHTSLSLDPRSADTWLDLALAEESEKNLAAAREAYLEAKRAYPASPQVSWRYANFLLRHDELDAALPQLRSAVEADPSLGRAAFAECWHVVPDIDLLLDRLLPPNRDVYLKAIYELTLSGETQPALAVWRRLVQLHSKLELNDASPLLNGLLQKSDITNAKIVWTEALDLSGTPRPSASGKSLIWDGGFETNTPSVGFAWRIQQAPGARIDYDEEVQHSGKRSLRIRFEGTQNLHLEGVCQYVPVEPKTSYQFSAWVRTLTVTTDTGVHFSLYAPECPRCSPSFTSDLKGTEPWTLLNLRWRAEKNVHLLRVCVAREPSAKLDNKIAGTAWVDDVSLVPF